MDSIWLKTIFWNKVIAPINFNWASATQPDGRDALLVNYLLGLTPGEFWDQKTFEGNAELQPFLKSEQATFWLRLLQHLKNGEEDQAYVLIQYNPFAQQSWDASILNALQRVLSYRRNGSLALQGDATAPSAKALIAPTTENALKGNLLNQLDQLSRLKGLDQPANDKIPEDLHELLMSPEVFSAVLLTGGWREAGLQLHKLKVIPSDFPQWVAYNIAEAMRQNRSVIDALKFATLQKNNPSLSLLTAELMMVGGKSRCRHG